MKKTLLLLLLILTLTNIYAKENSLPVSYRITDLLEADKKLTKNTINEISKLSLELNYQQTKYLYNQYVIDSTGPFLLNFFLGLGIGSFYQEDYVGGVVGLTGDILVVTSLVYFFSTYLTDMTSLSEDKDNMTITYDQYSSRALSRSETFYIQLAVVGGAHIATKLFQYIRPFTYAKDYNKKLNQALRPKVALKPILTPTFTDSGNTGLFLGATLKL